MRPKKNKPLPHPPSNEDNDDDDLELDPSDEDQPPNLPDSSDDSLDHDHHKGPPFPLDPKRDPDNTPPKDADAPLDQDFLHPTQSDFEPHREDQEEWQQLPRRSGRIWNIPT